MEIDRRHVPDPHPPEGMSERRACSDKECMEARNRWFTEELLPKLMIRFWIGIGTTVVALAGVFMFLSQVAIKDFELRAKSLYESQPTHDEDIARIEKNIDRLTAEMSHTMNAILDRLDRNYEEIKERRR